MEWVKQIFDLVLQQDCSPEIRRRIRCDVFVLRILHKNVNHSAKVVSGSHFHCGSDHRMLAPRCSESPRRSVASLIKSLEKIKMFIIQTVTSFFLGNYLVSRLSTTLTFQGDFCVTMMERGALRFENAESSRCKTRIQEMFCASRSKEDLRENDTEHIAPGCPNRNKTSRNRDKKKPPTEFVACVLRPFHNVPSMADPRSPSAVAARRLSWKNQNFVTQRNRNTRVLRACLHTPDLQ